MNIKNHPNTQCEFDALSKTICTNTLHIILWMKISKNHLEKKMLFSLVFLFVFCQKHG